MKIRINDENNDWTFGKSLNDYAIENDAIGRDIKTKINEWINDCFFNLNGGIDWATRMGLKGQKKLLDNDLKKIITTVEGVLALTKFSSELVDRNYYSNFEIYTIYSKSPYLGNVNIGA